MTLELVAPYILFALGVAGRVIIPYIQAALATDGPLKFDVRYLIGQLLSAAVALIPLVAGQEFIEQIGTLSLVGAALYGWGASDIGREVQKVFSK